MLDSADPESKMTSNSVSWLISTNVRTLEFEYNLACTRKGARVCFVMSPGNMIFAVLELWMSPLQWVLNW